MFIFFTGITFMLLSILYMNKKQRHREECILYNTRALLFQMGIIDSYYPDIIIITSETNKQDPTDEQEQDPTDEHDQDPTDEQEQDPAEENLIKEATEMMTRNKHSKSFDYLKDFFIVSS